MSEKTTKCLVWLLPAGSRAAPPIQRAAPPKAPWWKPEGHLGVSDEEPWGFDKQIAKSSPRGRLSKSKIPRFDMFGNALGKSQLPAPTCRRFLRSAGRSMLRPQAALGGLRHRKDRPGGSCSRAGPAYLSASSAFRVSPASAKPGLLRASSNWRRASSVLPWRA